MTKKGSPGIKGEVYFSMGFKILLKASVIFMHKLNQQNLLEFKKHCLCINIQLHLRGMA